MSVGVLHKGMVYGTGRNMAPHLVKHLDLFPAVAWQPPGVILQLD